MIEFLQNPHLAEERGHIVFEAVGPQRPDDNQAIVGPFAAQKRNAEAAGAKDALRLEAREGERLKGIGIQSDGAAQSRESFPPIAPLQSSAVDVVMRLGPRDRIDDESRHFLKIVLAGFEIADDDFELSQAVEQGRQSALLFDRQIAETLDEILHDFAFVVATQSHSVAGPHRAGVQIVTAFQVQDRFVQIRTGLTAIVLFRLQI
jgi:hypothetical protein